VCREVVFLAQHHAQPPAREVARDAGAIDAAAHDEHVAGRLGGRLAVRRRHVGGARVRVVQAVCLLVFGDRLCVSCRLGHEHVRFVFVCFPLFSF
jgi:hypothetical protein